jgi:hypothetical protein
MAALLLGNIIIIIRVQLRASYEQWTLLPELMPK